MKQAVLVKPESFEIREVPIPEITDNQALIRVRAVGICGSDIHAYYGKHPFISCPIVMGHEAAGDVVKIGRNVTNLKPGMRVVMRPQKVCGECYLCKTGRFNICKKLEVIGCQCTGASSDYFAVDANLLYELPENVDYAVGTVIEPLAVGVHAVKRGLADVKGKKILVIGAGTIGNVVAQSAKGLGAASVMVSDVSAFKLQMAKECGADYCVDVSKQNLADEILKAYGEDGVDAIYECSANAGALNQALDFARKGITIVIVAVYGKNPEVNLPNVQDREYNVVGTLMYVHEDYLDAIRLVAEKKVDLAKLITAHFPLEKVADAYHHIEKNRDTMQKVILDVE